MFILTAYLVRSSADSAEERAFQINSSFDDFKWLNFANFDSASLKKPLFF